MNTLVLPLTLLWVLLSVGCGQDDATASPSIDVHGEDAEGADVASGPDDAVPAVDADGMEPETDQVSVPPPPAESCVLFAPDAEDPSEALFDPECVLDVHVEMAPADWEALRRETRAIIDVVGEDCLEDPPSDVFSWREAAITVGGERVEGAGIRKKGFWGSLSTEKPALKVRFDKFVDGQHLGTLTRMTLNNVVQDPSYLNTCLAYHVMERAGLPAPRCNFARVRVNHVDQGLYVHVDSIKKPFLARHFSSDDGNLYEATLSDFRPEFRGTWEKKTHKAENDWSDLDAAVEALAAPDETLMAAAAGVFDLDGFMTHWAMEVLVGHWDGYAGNMNNTYIYADPEDGRFHFIPWGADSAFGDAQIFIGGEGKLPDAVYAFGHLADRLYGHPEGRTLYMARLQELLDTAWDGEAIVMEIDRMEALVSPHLSAADRETMSAHLVVKRNWITNRPAQVATEIAEPPDWTYPPRTSVCWIPAGTMSGTFDTDWGSSGWDYLNKVGTLDHDVDGLGLLGNIASNARDGTGPTDGYAVIELIGSGPDGEFIIVALFGEPGLVAPHTSVPIDWLGFSGLIGRLEFLDMDFEIIGLLTDGVLHFEDAGTYAGELVNGSFEAAVVHPP